MILLLLHYIGRLPKKKKRKKILVTLSLFLYLKKVYSFCRNKPFIKMGIFFFFLERPVGISTWLCSVFEAFSIWGNEWKEKVTCLKGKRFCGSVAATAMHSGQPSKREVSLSKQLKSQLQFPGYPGEHLSL